MMKMINFDIITWYGTTQRGGVKILAYTNASSENGEC